MAQVPRLEREVNYGVYAQPVSDGGAGAQFFNELKQIGNQQLDKQSAEHEALMDAKSQSTITQTMANIHDESMKFSNDPSEQSKYFNEKAKAFNDSYVSQLPRSIQARALLTANGSMQLYNNKFNNAIEQQQKVNASLTYYDANQKALSAMTTAQNMNTKEGDEAAANRYSKIHNNAIKAAQAGLRTPEQAYSDIKFAQDKFISNDFIRHVESTAAVNPQEAQKYIDEVAQKGVNGYTNEQTETLINRGRSIINRHQQALELHDDVLRRTSQALVAEAQQTGKVNTAKLQSFQGQVTDEQFQKTLADINHGMAINAQAAQLMSQTPLERATHLNALKDNDYEQFLDVSKQFATQQQAFNDDSVPYLQNHPFVAQSIIKQQLVSNGINDKDADIRAQGFILQSPYDALVRTQKLMGKSDQGLQVMPKATAIQTVIDLTSKPLGDTRGDNGQLIKGRVSELNDLAQQYGDQASVAFKQLAKQGLPLQTQLLANLPPESQPYIPAAIDAFTDGEQELNKRVNIDDRKTIETTLNKDLSPLLSTFTHFNAMPSGKLNELQQSAQILAMGLLDKRIVSSPKDAASLAANVLFNNVYDTDTINNQPFRIPKSLGLTTQATTAGYALIDAMDINRVSVPKYYAPNLAVNEQNRRNLYYQERIKHGYFVTSANNESMQLVDSMGFPVNDTSGRPFKITFKDLKQSDSDISKTLNLYLKNKRYLDGYVFVSSGGVPLNE